jgi:hypothetical protein
MIFSPKTSRPFLAAVGLLLFSLVPSFAEVLVFSTTIPSAAPGFSTGFALPAFDSDLGTLDVVAFSYAISASGSLPFQSNSEFGGFGGSIVSVNILATPSNTGPDLQPAIIPVSVGVSGGGLPPGSYIASGSGGASGDASPDFASYWKWQAPGGGFLGFNLSSGSASFQGGGSYTWGAPTMEESSVFTVTYTYTPVPEPTALALAGAGVLGLLARRRRG